MSKMIEAYRAYLTHWLETHPGIIEPEIHNLRMDEPLPKELAEPAVKEEREMGRVCKVWSDLGLVLLSASGKVYEVCCKNNRTLIAVFPNQADWLKYDKPKSIQEYLGWE
jgi:hypothetical protein